MKKKKGKILAHILPLALGGVIGAVIGLWGGEWISRVMEGMSAMQVLGAYAALVLGAVAAYMVHIIVHEAGHLVCGLATGYGFSSFRVMNLMIHRDAQGKIRLSRMQVAGTAGQCLMTPPPDEENYPYLLYNLGGVLANLALGAVCALLAWAVRGVPLLTALLAVSAIIGVLTAALNGIPMKGLNVSNDGNNIRLLRKSAAARRAFWLQMTINERITRGMRLRDMPEEWFRPIGEDGDNPLVCTIEVLRANRLMDEMALAQAEETIAALLKREKGLMPIYRALLTVDGACCELVLGHPGPMTQALDNPDVQKITQAMKTFPNILCVRCITALLRDGDREKYAQAVADMRKLTALHPHQQEIDSLWELIDLAEEAAKGA